MNKRVAQLADFITALLGLVVPYYLWTALHVAFRSVFPKPFVVTNELFVLGLFLCLVYVVLFNLQKAYSYLRFTSLYTEYSIVLRIVILGLLIKLLALELLGYKNMPRTIFILSFSINLLFFITEKTLLFYLSSWIRKKGINRKRIIIVGTGTRSQQLIDIINRNLEWGLDIIGLLTGDAEKVGKQFYGYKVLDTYDKIETILKEKNPEEVFITISTKRFDQIRDVLEACEREGVQVRLNSDFFGYITKNVKVDNVYGLNIISFSTVHHSETQIAIKRAIDIVGALFALVVFSPLMIIAAIGIWLTDGRPVLYDWNVVGLNKKPFRSWKFRTMVKDADVIKPALRDKNEMDGPVFKIKKDPRIIPFGHWLRKWSIDETPQLFSVLKGDMSLVGPRPAGPHELKEYQSWQRRKLSVRPGLTCLWQANGRNSINRFDDWVKLDLKYIDTWSIWLDIKILMRTIPAIISRKGAS